MAYLTCIGGHGTAGRTVGRFGSRGYWIFRRGTAVIIRYGAVQITRGRTVRVEWLGWREVLKRKATVAEAKTLMQRIIRAKTRPEHGYTRLKRGVRIY